MTKGIKINAAELKKRRQHAFQIDNTHAGLLQCYTESMEERDQWVKLLEEQSTKTPPPKPETEGKIGSNTGVQGRIVDAQGNPHVGLLVQAVDKDPIVRYQVEAGAL